METQRFELFGGRTLHTAFFKDVKNSAALRQAVLNQEINFALINARMVVDLFAVHAAAARALLCDQDNKLITKTLNAELVFNLSGSRNVAESFRRFGLTDECDQILVCVFDADEDAISKALALVDGTLIDTPSLKEALGPHLAPNDVAMIRKYYKIQDTELQTSTLSDAVTSRIATKSCNK
ncbi:hypothetical protein P43SY_011976 [Pythium insidiosum]|uniref:EKC/KEOPS complex subunit CGI121 n=1 Tax=Pythium insidiosum TaxID=114742 RepID=A0AAD5LBD2_PYTIN|nr:hypothetical protein P43SY_011976 [Pythium insidiosum]